MAIACWCGDAQEHGAFLFTHVGSKHQFARAIYVLCTGCGTLICAWDSFVHVTQREPRLNVCLANH